MTTFRSTTRVHRAGAVLVAAAALAACGSSSTKATGSSPAATSAVSVGGCTFTPATNNSGRNPGLPTTVVTTGNELATITFPSGAVSFSMDTSKTPCTAASFKHLADAKYFDNTKCHRLTTQGIFVLQCGDPTGTGTGGPGYTIPDENLTGAMYPKGTVAMANTGTAHSGGSQFFLCYADTQLPATYTPFGIITAGEPVLDAIAAQGTTDGGADGAPKGDASIQTFTVT